MLNTRIYADNPQRKLGIMALYLYVKARQAAHNDRYPYGDAVADFLASYTEWGCTRLPRSLSFVEFNRASGCAFMTSLNNGETPQWFLDKYTEDGTLDTVKYDILWHAFKTLRDQVFAGGITGHLSNLFGGFCSAREGTAAMWVGTYQNGSRYPNSPWVDSGCKNRWPQNLTASPGAVGAIDVAWEAPLYMTTPRVNAYAVHWKSGDQDYDSTRQALVEVGRDYFGKSSRTITGLTAGTTATAGEE